MKLAPNIADMINSTTSAMEHSQVSNNSMASVVICDKIALDFFLMGQNSNYAITDISYFNSIIILNQVKRSMQKFKKKITWISMVDADGLWNLYILLKGMVNTADRPPAAWQFYK